MFGCQGWLRTLCMLQESEMTRGSTTAPVARSAAAERMRAHRERRRQGLRCVAVKLREREVDVLIQQGLLEAVARNDPYALSVALHAHFDRTLKKAL
jgi:hypothetical protein